MDLTPGYIPSIRTETDYLKGINSPLVSAVFPGFDWRTVRPVLDLQNINGFESFGCVSWTGVQAVEEMLNALIRQNRLPQTHLDFLNENGYIVNGKVVCSKAYIWVLSATGQGSGNTFGNVASAIKNSGLIPESIYPFNPAPGAKWSDVYKQPTQKMLDMGKRFKDFFDIGYHYLTDKNFSQHLDDGPIQIAIPICPGYNNDNPIKACSGPEAHSVLIDYVDSVNEKEIIDHYNPEVKLLSKDYPVPAAMQYVITIKEQTMEFYQVQGESTVVKKEGGKYFEIATDPQFFPYIKALFSIPDSLNMIGRDVVNANLGGQLVVGITYVKK